MKAAHQGSVFVTPPLGDWTLAAGTALFPLDRADTFVKPLVERLSREFGDAQFYCTQQDIGLHVWARARKGRLARGFAWLGQQNLTLWDEGKQSREERDLGFPLLVAPAVKQEDSFPDEGSVFQLASFWSIDPMSLDAEYREPVPGLLGRRRPGQT
jgi:hypothetical protein